MANLKSGNCGWCGIRIREEGFCGNECHNKMKAMLAIPAQGFATYSQAARFLGRDARTIRRFKGTLFWIDKTLFGPTVKAQTCRVCDAQFKTGDNRNGFCPMCSRAGEGRKSQGRIIAERYAGEGNPNFTNGQSKKTFRHFKDGKDWAKAVVKRDGACRACGEKQQLQAHHVLPATLFPEFLLDLNNGVTLHPCHHTEVHRLRLDVLLLPNLYESKEDVLPLHEAFCRQPLFQEVGQLPFVLTRKRELLRVVPKNYQKLLLRLHPEFAQQVLHLSESK